MPNYLDLLKNKNVIAGDNLSFDNNGCYDITYSKNSMDSLKSFYVADDYEKLYVFLSAKGVFVKDDPYPVFHRISWNENFKGIKIFFDDPTRIKISMAPSFYFGDVELDYLKKIAEIVNHIKERHSIDNSNITFISSSNGGFAALYLANEFVSSNCISLCPQFDVRLFLGDRYASFKERVGINEKNEEIVNHRLNVYRLYANSHSKFFIYSNIACISDKIQLSNFCNYIGIEYKMGLNKVKDNLYLLVSDFNNTDPHVIQPGVDFCTYIDRYFWNSSDDEKIFYTSILMKQLQQFNSLEFKTKFIFNLLTFIQNPNNIRIKSLDNGKYFDVFFNNNAYLRINIGNMIKPSFRINKIAYNLDSEFVRTVANNNNCLIDLNSETWINIYMMQSIPSFAFHNWLYNLIKQLNITV